MHFRSFLLDRWPMKKNQNVRGASISAVVAVKSNPFAGPARAVFKSVIPVWKRICGGLPVAELTGNAPIAGP